MAETKPGGKYSILVAPRGTTTIPVTCTERRRWRYGDSRDSSPVRIVSDHALPLELPRLMPPVRRHEIRSRQVSMWHEIQRKHCALGVLSQTDNLSDAMETHWQKIEELRLRLSYPEGASGIAVAFGNDVVSIDLFDQPTTLARLWDRLVMGIAMDALEVTDAEQVATVMDVTAKLYSVRRSAWEPTLAVGLGESYFTKAADGAIGTALVVDGHLIHGSVSMPRFPAGTFSGDLG